MKLWTLTLLICMLLALSQAAPIGSELEREEELHFGFHTDNGYQRSEDITYKVKVNPEHRVMEESPSATTEKSVAYRGGYSFISADGYEYQVLYKADKNGFRPYVTAHKVKPTSDNDKPK